MKRSLFISIVLMAHTAFAQTGDTEKLVANLKQFTVMQANFTQSLMLDKQSKAQQTQGKMALRRPGKFYWEITQPNQQILVADGSHLWIYDVDLEQVVRQKQRTSNQNSPAVFLTGDLDQISARFSVKERVKNDFELSAKSSDDMFQRIQIQFSDSKLSQMQVETKLGQKSRFTFSDVKLNPTLNYKPFQFVPPKGVDVIYNEE